MELEICLLEPFSTVSIANFGCFAASKTVQNSGPRLAKDEYLEIKETFSSY